MLQYYLFYSGLCKYLRLEERNRKNILIYKLKIDARCAKFPLNYFINKFEIQF